MLGLRAGRTYDNTEVSTGPVREVELSRQLVRLVDVVYALVLVQGAIYYRHIFTIGNYFKHATRFGPVVLALTLTYFTTIQSFVDYHLASEDQRYRLLTKGKRGLDLIRFYLDLVIVGLYSFMLLKFHVLIGHPLMGSSSADISAALWALPGIFLLYFIWGILRAITSDDEQEYAWWLLLIFLGLYAGLAAGYKWIPGGPSSLRNSSALGAALLLMIVYRVLNSTQNPHY